MVSRGDIWLPRRIRWIVYIYSSLLLQQIPASLIETWKIYVKFTINEPKQTAAKYEPYGSYLFMWWTAKLGFP